MLITAILSFKLHKNKILKIIFITCNPKFAEIKI